MSYEAVFFDFDGVILDSVDVKTQAFAQMFRKYGADVESKVVAYHLENGGLSRVKKFEYFYESLLKRPLNEEELGELCQSFSQLTLEKVLEAPFMHGAFESLQMLKYAGIPAFVVSGTPDEEIKFIVEKRELSSFFIEVHGSPRRKYEIVADISRRCGYELSNCLFVGDALTDLEAARRCCMHFVGITKYSEVNPFPVEVLKCSDVRYALNMANY